ncbi:MAG: phospho-sugar mutase, partial [Flavobacteriaceae bacterium]
MDVTLQTAKGWLSDFFDGKTKLEVENLLKNDPEELKDRFYKHMEFGTGGMRGVMGVGTNRINKYTLGKSTQGLSNYLKETYPAEQVKV